MAVIVVYKGNSAFVGSPITLLAGSKSDIALAKAQASGSSSSGLDPKTKAMAEPEPVSAPSVAPVSVILSNCEGCLNPASEGGKRVVATPYAKKLAKDLNVDLATMVGSGPMGRIAAKNVELATSSAAISEKRKVVAAASSNFYSSIGECGAFHNNAKCIFLFFF